MLFKKSDDWATPEDIYKHFINDLECIDPCPLFSEYDNLDRLYVTRNIYINPPYSKINEWVKFIKNNYKFNIIYLLIPSRTDTKYFHELMNIECCKVLYFIKGRLKFGNSKKSAPFPSVLIKIYPGASHDIKTEFINRDELLKIV